MKYELNKKYRIGNTVIDKVDMGGKNIVWRIFHNENTVYKICLTLGEVRWWLCDHKNKVVEA